MKLATAFVIVVTAFFCCAAPIAAALFPDSVLVAPEDSSGVARADFDLDGHADLAIACLQSSHLFVFFGNGDGSFIETRLEAARTPSPWATSTRTA